MSPVIAEAVVLSADQCSTGAALEMDGSIAAAAANHEVTHFAVGISDLRSLCIASNLKLLGGRPSSGERRPARTG